MEQSWDRAHQVIENIAFPSSGGSAEFEQFRGGVVFGIFEGAVDEAGGDADLEGYVKK